MAKIDNNTLTLHRPSNQKRHKALHGLTRALAQNAVIGVTQGYTKTLQLVGIGYKVAQIGDAIEINVGKSHTTYFLLPPNIDATVVNKGKEQSITLTSIDKQLLGQVCAKIRNIRKPEPYKGKGIRFKDEVIIRKAGKTAAKK